MAIKAIPKEGPFEKIRDGYFAHDSGLIMEVRDNVLVELKWFYTNDRDPHRSVYLYDAKKNKKTCYVYQLVLAAFVGYPGKEYRGVHINGDFSDCRIENLEWRVKTNQCLWNILNEQEMEWYIKKMDTLDKAQRDNLNEKLMAAFMLRSREFVRDKSARAEFFRQAFKIKPVKRVRPAVVAGEQINFKF